MAAAVAAVAVAVAEAAVVVDIPTGSVSTIYIYIWLPPRDAQPNPISPPFHLAQLQQQGEKGYRLMGNPAVRDILPVTFTGQTSDRLEFPSKRALVNGSADRYWLVRSLNLSHVFGDGAP